MRNDEKEKSTTRITMKECNPVSDPLKAKSQTVAIPQGTNNLSRSMIVEVKIKPNNMNIRSGRN